MSIVIFFLIFLIKYRNYESSLFKHIDKKEHSLYALYPFANFVLNNLENSKLGKKVYGLLWGEEIQEKYSGLYRKEYKVQLLLAQCKQISIGILLLMIFSFLGLVIGIKSKNETSLYDSYMIERPEHEGGEKRVKLDAYLIDENTYETFEYEIDIYSQQYTQEEAEILFLEFIERLDTYILKDNKDRNQITSDLSFPSTIPSTSLKLQWKSSNIEIADKSGKINTKGLGSEVIEITFSLEYMNLSISHSFMIQVVEDLSINKANMKEKIKELIEIELEESKTKEKIELPSQIDDKKLNWVEVKNQKDIVVFLFGILSTILIIYGNHKQIQQEYEKRNQQMLYDYSEVISKVCLYLRVGMSLRSVWDKIVVEYLQEKREVRYIYEEMIITRNEMELGLSEVAAFEHFSRRVKLPPYLRFISLITQNMQKGNDTMLISLEYEARDAFLVRKEMIKKLGAQASTKLLVPMMIMLVIVLLLIMVPAFLSFSI